MELKLTEVIQEPYLTEKTNLLRADNNVVVFKVHPKANKIVIKKAVQTIFGVEVEDVKVINVRKKRKRGKKGILQRKPEYWKKALVKIKEGQTIDFFEGV